MVQVVLQAEFLEFSTIIIVYIKHAQTLEHVIPVNVEFHRPEVLPCPIHRLKTLDSQRIKGFAQDCSASKW